MMIDSTVLNNTGAPSLTDNSSFEDKKNELSRQMTALLMFSLELEDKIRNLKNKRT